MSGRLPASGSVLVLRLRRFYWLRNKPIAMPFLKSAIILNQFPRIVIDL